MKAPLFCDSETRSRVKLSGPSGVGGRVYAEHPSTEVVCWCFRMPDGEQIDWSPFRPREVSAAAIGRELGIALAFGHPVAAHNWDGFDRFIWQTLGWPTPKETIDTSAIARVRGYPKADLDYLMVKLLGRHKDKEGSKLTQSLSAISRARGRVGQFRVDLYHQQGVLDRVIQYCNSDVDGLAGIFHQYLHEWVGMDLPGYVEVQRAMNDRGVRFDVELARALLVADEILGEEAVEKTGETAEAINSHAQFRDLLLDLGVDAPDATADTVDSILQEAKEAIREEGEQPDLVQIVRLCEARRALSSIARGKLRAGLRCVSRDGYLRDNLRYYGAHTGRDSGQRMQLHNLAKGPPLELDDSIAALLRGELRMHVLAKGKPGQAGYKPAHWADLNAEGINSLVRACLVADEGYLFVVGDWAQIEGRCLAWAADEKKAVALYERLDAGDKSADPYKVQAAELYGIGIDQVSSEQRQFGKVCILGCGYQMGHKRFHEHAIENGIDWSQTGGLTAKDAVKGWRRRHENIVAFWYEMQEAALDVVQARGTTERKVGPYTWVRYEDLVFNKLPSGRLIVYEGMSAHRSEDEWGKKRWSLRYAGRKGPEHTYGGKLVENATQAACGDIMREGVIAVDQAGLRPFLTVHDELLGQAKRERAKEALALMLRKMCVAPTWAEGMPIAAEGYVSERYKKG